MQPIIHAPIRKDKAIYKEKEVFVIANNFNGTVDIAEAEGKSHVGEKVWIGVERAVEKEEVKFL